MTTAKHPKSDTSRAPWPVIPGTSAIGKGGKRKRPLIPIEQLTLVDDPAPTSRLPHSSRYDALFDGCLKQGKLIKTPADTAASVASMLRHWLSRKGLQGYSPRSVNCYDTKDGTGRVWLVQAGSASAKPPAAPGKKAAKKGGAA